MGWETKRSLHGDQPWYDRLCRCWYETAQDFHCQYAVDSPCARLLTCLLALTFHRRVNWILEGVGIRVRVVRVEKEGKTVVSARHIDNRSAYPRRPVF